MTPAGASPLAAATRLSGGAPSEALSPEKRAQFDAIAATAREAAGLHIVPEKSAMVFSRIGKRLRALGLASLDDYIALIRGPGAAQEREHLISALTTNVTSFFREDHHFAHFADAILPGLIARARAGGRVRLWSSACSSGQEAYSLAMVVLERFPEAARHDLRILASDIDHQVLATARAATYPADLVAPLTAGGRDRFLRPAEGDEVAVKDEVRALVAFRHLNLMGNWPMKGRFDVIFCRNVMIYFDQPTQNRLISRFAEVCAPGAVLYLGHSERIDPASGAPFRQVGQTTFVFEPAAAAHLHMPFGAHQEHPDVSP
ncbi:CheR family methyltransferase [Vannielia litorea]|uniref:Chemotaxis protein methyltransferase n=1 Tax=Vannielia litorea TaxID=1217970 RepID=A0A1N6F2V6_9RHOB|nr:protein-glutamate O-methyltransferase [Vannielia litorea]SIN89601.1 MCP methyltransferase, CheR-type [Vannielia litorea]